MLSSSLIYYFFHRRREQEDKAPTEAAGQRPSETPIPPKEAYPRRTNGSAECFQNPSMSQRPAGWLRSLLSAILLRIGHPGLKKPQNATSDFKASADITTTKKVRRLAAVLLPLPSSVFLPDQRFQGNTVENCGKGNPQTGTVFLGSAEFVARTRKLLRGFSSAESAAG